MNNDIFEGKVVPEMIDPDKGLNCDNAFCMGISCFDCINYPTDSVVTIRHDYLTEEHKDELITNGLERLFDDRDDSGC